MSVNPMIALHAYHEGLYASKAGKAIGSCPYPVGHSARDGWLRGFQSFVQTKAK